MHDLTGARIDEEAAWIFRTRRLGNATKNGGAGISLEAVSEWRKGMEFEECCDVLLM